MSKTPAEMTPAEIDGEIARIDTEYFRQQAISASAERTISSPQSLQYQKEDAERSWGAAQQKMNDLALERAPFVTEFKNRGGWSRYFLVTNSNGHVHSSTSCATCFPTTEYGWLTELSGATEAEMVEEFGESACTVCFPSAPTLPAFRTSGSRNAAAKAARDAEKAEKAAAKAAKAITAPDGSELRVPDGFYQGRDGVRRQSYETVATKVGAQRVLSSAVQSYGWYGDTHPSDFGQQIRVLAEALKAADIDPEPIIARAAKKATKEGAPHSFPGLA